jgi:hypothetical protein
VIGGKDNSVKWAIDTSTYAGTFQVGEDFDPNTGLYTAPFDGLYMVAALARINAGVDWFADVSICYGSGVR